MVRPIAIGCPVVLEKVGKRRRPREELEGSGEDLHGVVDPAHQHHYAAEAPGRDVRPLAEEKDRYAYRHPDRSGGDEHPGEKDDDGDGAPGEKVEAEEAGARHGQDEKYHRPPDDSEEQSPKNQVIAPNRSHEGLLDALAPEVEEEDVCDVDLADLKDTEGDRSDEDEGHHIVGHLQKPGKKADGDKAYEGPEDQLEYGEYVPL